MSLYKFNVTVKVDDGDNKYNAVVLYCAIKNAVQRYLRSASLHHNSNVKIERDFKI